jgi:hypothetical protein
MFFFFKTRVKETVTATSFTSIMQTLPSKHQNQKVVRQFQLSFRNVTIQGKPNQASLIGISCKHNKYSDLLHTRSVSIMEAL